jgi:hypothetical protein
MSEALRLIALRGRAGAGKDSAAAVLVRHLNYRSIAFADALRAEVVDAWRIDPRMLEDRATKELAIPALAVGNCGDTQFVRAVLCAGGCLLTPRSPRWVMQRWGDSQKLRHGRDYYAEIVRRWIGREFGRGWSRIVVTDLRFQAEYAALRSISERGLRVVHVFRPDQTPRTDGHVSETELDGVELPATTYLQNSGTLEDLVSATLRTEAALFPEVVR